jgi:hypothetical protein
MTLLIYLKTALQRFSSPPCQVQTVQVQEANDWVEQSGPGWIFLKVPLTYWMVLVVLWLGRVIFAVVRAYHSVAKDLLTMVSLYQSLEVSVRSSGRIYSDVSLVAAVWKGLGASSQPEVSLGRQAERDLDRVTRFWRGISICWEEVAMPCSHYKGIKINQSARLAYLTCTLDTNLLFGAESLVSLRSITRGPGLA